MEIGHESVLTRICKAVGFSCCFWPYTRQTSSSSLREIVPTPSEKSRPFRSTTLSEPFSPDFNVTEAVVSVKHCPMRAAHFAGVRM